MRDEKETKDDLQMTSEEVLAETTEKPASDAEMKEETLEEEMDEAAARIAGNMVKRSILESWKNKTVYFLCFMLMLIILAGTALSSIFIQKIKESRARETSPHEDVLLSLEGPAETDMEEEPEEALQIDTASADNGQWKKIIFGDEEERTGIGSLLFISGLTDSEKSRISFAEADFVKELSLFLAGEGLTTNRLIIEDRISCSSDSAMAFQARLQGHDEYVLDIIFYPDYPGEYIFTLREVKDNERNQSQQSAGSRISETESQTRVQDQISMQTQTETGAQREDDQPQSETQQSERNYDASRLSIEDMPPELLNYISNEYTFRFELYDFLYNNGSTGAQKAYVTDYVINGDERTAVISLTADDGSSVSVIYDKDSDTYSFRR